MNKSRRYALLVRTLWLALVCCSGSTRSCSGCSDCGRAEPARAVLYELRGGSIQGERAASSARWEALEPGAEFLAGDGARTDPHTSAKLRLPGGSELWLGPASQVRFMPDAASGEQGIDLITGDAIIKTGNEELHLRTHVGVATLQPGSSLHLTRAEAALQLRLEVGEASFRGADGKSLELTKGDGVQVAIGSAVIRIPSGAAPAQPRPSAADSILLRIEAAGLKARPKGAAGFESLAIGEVTLAPETELTLAEGASATLVRDRDRVRLSPGEYTAAQADALVAARSGKLHVETQSRDVHVSVPGGFIVARVVPGGTECDVEVSGNEGTVSVTRGEATWNTSSGQTVVKAGTPYHWTVAESAATSTAEATEAEAGPERVSLVVRAGESFVVHAAELPVALGVQLDHVCSGEAVVELKGGPRARGTGTAQLWLSNAVRGYSVRCLSNTGKPGAIKARGGARALEDAGTRELPRRPPTSLVDADGRSYTIYYQNQLPDIRIRWPNAPVIKQYLLEVDDSVMPIDKPEHTFVSGSLRDGTHRLTFSAKERRSRTTHIEVCFDNTTATASLSTPANRSFSPGRTVEIEGIALPAWKVSVDGGMIESSGDGRFRGHVVTNEKQPDFAVRLSHPRLGTHYYVRRASSSP